MNKEKIMNILKKAATFEKRHAAALLTGVAVVGLVTTAVTAYKAGKKVDDILAKHEENLKRVKKTDNNKEKTQVIKEVAKDMAPIIVPPVVLGVATAGCILGSHSVSNRRIAALSAAYSISESALKDMDKKMREVLGEKKTQSIKDAITKDKLKESDPPKKEQIIITGDGDCLCKDMYTGRFFRSNADKIGRAINYASAEARNCMYVRLNDFYDQLGLDSVPMGEDLGWNVDDLVDGTLPITYTAILTDDDRPCLCLDYTSHLRKEYRDLY